jgi:hypothetical protein
MCPRVEIRPKLLAWARERSRLAPAELERRFPRLPGWESGEALPTLKQVERFANATHTPIGFLFLTTPPEEQVPIPDFRTIAAAGLRAPSPDLLDTMTRRTRPAG